MKIKNGIVSLFVLFIISCDNPLTQDEDLHCIVDYNGFYDDCNICSGGSSGHIANSEKDCNDECSGMAVIDVCGVCDGDGTSCDDTCENFGCDNVCNSGLINDECGICNGDNSDKDLCGICFGDNNSCDVGLITLAEWHFSEMHFWNNSDCNGFPYTSFYNHVCIEETCYDYEINFYFDIFDGSYRFSQINKAWIINSPNDITENIISGIWYFDNSAFCLDYDSLELQDNCYESIEFENTFFDCETNINNCIDNIVNFSNMNDIEETCSKEKFDTINNELTNNSSNSVSIENFTITLKNLLISLDYFSN